MYMGGYWDRPNIFANGGAEKVNGQIGTSEISQLGDLVKIDLYPTARNKRDRHAVFTL